MPARAIARLLRNDWRYRYRDAVRRWAMALDGIQLEVADSWATPTLRDHIHSSCYEHTERRILQDALQRDDRYSFAAVFNRRG